MAFHDARLQRLFTLRLKRARLRGNEAAQLDGAIDAERLALLAAGVPMVQIERMEADKFARFPKST